MAVSIFDLPPIEQGGTDNRKGIHFQDHVAADFCLSMLSEGDLAQVWCETQDDITLLWEITGGHAVEFVQVKSDEMDQLWSPAGLCRRDDRKKGSSILEKSLANDRALEHSSFRIVTARAVHSDLNLLTLKPAISTRDHKSKSFKDLVTTLKTKVGDYESPNGNDCEFWAENATWDVLHSSNAARDGAKLKLRKFLESQGHNLMSDQLDEVYSRLLNLVQDAACAKYSVNPSAKRIKRSDLINWLAQTVTITLHPAMSGTGKQLDKKMRAASLASDIIATAQEERRYYREESLKPKYLELTDLERMKRDVIAKLQVLKSRMDAGEITKTGIEFHHMCLTELEALANPKSGIAIPSELIHGAMYNVVDRCLHRFARK